MSENGSQGNLSSQSPGAIAVAPHEDFKDMKWVPKFALPPEVSFLLQVCGVLGGALLGAGLGSSLMEPRLAEDAIHALAVSCAEKSQACDALNVVGSSSSATVWTIIGVILVIAPFIVGIRLQSRKKSTTSKS